MVVQDQQKRDGVAHDGAHREAGQQQRDDRRPATHPRQGVHQRHRHQRAAEGQDRDRAEAQEGEAQRHEKAQRAAEGRPA